METSPRFPSQRWRTNHAAEKRKVKKDDLDEYQTRNALGKAATSSRRHRYENSQNERQKKAPDQKSVTPMKTKKGHPPNYQMIKAALNPKPSTIFSYGDTIFVPSGNKLPQELHDHEQVHSDRQGDKPDAWWNLYLHDPEFRLLEEVAAHMVEFASYCSRISNPKKRRNYAKRLATKLASPIYGNMITKDVALALFV
jgi:hypothetical protein